MKNRGLLFLGICFLVLIICVACGTKNDNVLSDDDQVETNDGADSTDAGDAENAGDHEDAGDYTWDGSEVIHIVLKGSSASVDSTGVSVEGSKVTITSAGTYSISGALTNGQIIVDTADKDIVRLILNGADIGCSNSAPVYVKNADKAIIVLADNTKNTITDGTSYVFESSLVDEPNAAVFSSADLTIYGNGSLTVKGNYADGIAGKDGLIIKSGTIDVTAVDDGIRGKDYLLVRDGNITVNAKGDGLKSDNTEDATKGYISIDTCVANVTSSGGDAIAAETDVAITGGTFNLVSGGGSSKTKNDTISTKGIKAGVSLTIDGGTFTINSSDDAIHSTKNAVIGGGTFAISSGDDGIHADSNLIINGGIINLEKCYEGIESASITINDGNIHVTASDDGINGAGGNDGSGMGGWGGQLPSTGNYYLYLNGGYIVVNAVGDGVDVNGSIVMTGGDLIVNGPVNNGNGALDYDTTFKTSGGSIVAVGSSGMAQAPDATSIQCSVLVTLRAVQQAGTIVYIQTSAGEEILCFKPVKKFQSIAFSSPKLVKGGTYDLYLGGSSTGTVADGLYQDGTYTPGTKYSSFTVSGIVTKVQ